MYISCLAKTWRVQTRHSLLGVIAVSLSPLVAILALYLAQVSLYKTTHLERFTCGCKCVRHGEFGCVEYDRETCGLMYSTAEQAPFCQVSQPPLWPAVLNVPPGTGTEALILYTGDDMEMAASVMERLLATGEEVGKRAASSYVRSMVLDDLEDDYDLYGAYEVDVDDVDDFLDTTGALTRGLYDFGVVLGTSADRGQLVHHQMLVDSAFAPNQGDLYVLLANNTSAVGEDGKGPASQSSQSSQAVVAAIAGSIGNLTNKDVRPLFTGYVPYDSLGSMQRHLHSRPLDEGTVSTRSAVPTLAGLDWRDSSAASGLHVDIYVDALSAQSSRLNFRWAQSINLAFNAYLRHFNESSVTLAGIKDMPRPRNELKIDFSILLGPLLTVWIMHIVLPVELYHLVYEKERNLRVYQYLNGLRPVAYYAATWVTHLTFYALTMATFVGLGYTFGIKMMVLNSFSVQLVFWCVVVVVIFLTGISSVPRRKAVVTLRMLTASPLTRRFSLSASAMSLWGSVITSFGFLISQLFRQKRSVILLSLFYTLSIGFVANVVLVVFVEQGMNGVVIALQSLIPSFCAFRGLYELSSYAFLADQTNRPGLQWSMLRSDPGMLVVLIQLAVQSVVIPLLAIYTEREWLFSYGGGERSRAAGSTAVPKGRPTKQARQASKDDALDHYLGYIGGGMQFDSDDDGSAGSARQITRRASSMGYYFAGASGGGHLPLPSVEPTLRFGANLPNANDSQQPNGLDEDDNDGDGEPSLGPSVLYRGVRKAQPKSDISIPCLAVRDKEIFCFLADDPMCASTLLKMTGGFSCPDDGTILVRGKDSRELVGELRTRISIVFNGDILFEELTGMEHLQYYVRTRLGRLTDADASRYIQSAVEILELHSSIHKRVSSCSSGMRRRLSLAISLLGYPERGRLPDVLLMHEPTRSMDPYSRKVLWRALGSLRRKTAVVIATSSISEAESCDRVAVMKEGAPIFVGSPQHLIFARGRFIFLAFTVGAGDGQPGNSPSRKPPPRAHNKLPDATERTTRNADQVISFVKQHIQGAELLHNWGGGPVVKLKFKVPLGRGAPTAGDDPYELGKHRETEGFHAHQSHDHQPRTIDTVFRVVERARAANTIHILDYRVANCNLEDVYLDMVS